MHNVALISAVAENDVIGSDGGLPWEYDADLRHFRAKTLNTNVIMGRKTHESIIDHLGHPLADRHSIVLTSNPDCTDCDSVVFCQSVDAALAETQTSVYDETFVIGGESVYEQFMPYATRMVITEIPGEYEGDTFFPEYDETEWEEVERTTDGELAFVTYERTNNPEN
jgi:dihydrofolate reductase